VRLIRSACDPWLGPDGNDPNLFPSDPDQVGAYQVGTLVNRQGNGVAACVGRAG
jgi:hypothetical protein